MPLNELQIAIQQEVETCILPFWQHKAFDVNTSVFHGRVYPDNSICPDTDLGGILMSRVIWAFSMAASTFNNKDYLQHASLAKTFVDQHMTTEDKLNSLWSRDGLPYPNSMDKQISQAYRLYAYTEFFSATQSIETTAEKTAPTELKALFTDVINQLPASTKLIKSDHSDLYACWRVAYHQLEACLNFSKKYSISSTEFEILSYSLEAICHGYIELPLNSGHIFSAAWLLLEALDFFQVKKLKEEFTTVFANQVKTRITQFQDQNGGLAITEEDQNCYGWVQAEAFVACWKLYQSTKDEAFLLQAQKIFTYIQKYLSDPQQGEWHDKPVYQQRSDIAEVKSDFWKCPYHSVRACLEVYNDLNNLNDIDKASC